MMLELNKLYNMDCMEGVDKLPEANLILTDPPYPNNADHFINGIDAAIKFMTKYYCKHWMIFWDEMTTPPLNLPLVAKHIWHRSNTNRPDNYEVIYEFHIDGNKRASRVLSYPVIYPGLTGCVEATGHPTQKNKKLIKKLIEISNEKGLIIDPFIGSGTTAIAAMEIGMDWIGIEIDKEYYETANKRIKVYKQQLKLYA